MVRLLSCEVNMAKARLTKMAKLLLYAKQRGYVGVIQLDVDLDGIEVYWLESKEFSFFVFSKPSNFIPPPQVVVYFSLKATKIRAIINLSPYFYKI